MADFFDDGILAVARNFVADVLGGCSRMSGAMWTLISIGWATLAVRCFLGCEEESKAVMDLLKNHLGEDVVNKAITAEIFFLGYVVLLALMFLLKKLMLKYHYPVSDDTSLNVEFWYFLLAVIGQIWEFAFAFGFPIIAAVCELFIDNKDLALVALLMAASVVSHMYACAPPPRDLSFVDISLSLALGFGVHFRDHVFVLFLMALSPCLYRRVVNPLATWVRGQANTAALDRSLRHPHKRLPSRSQQFRQNRHQS